MVQEKTNKKNGIVRIKDIAEKAGVSAGTVDRVLHNRGRVSQKVKEKVLEIAKTLNYEPNVLAQALVAKKKFKIAALIPDESVDEYWAAPRLGIEKAEHDLRQFGVDVTQHIFNPFNVDSFNSELKKVSQTHFDGILLAPIFTQESLPAMSQWEKNNIPFNLFNTHIPDYSPLSYIGQDSYQSGLLAANLLQYAHSEPSTFIVAHIDEDIQNSPHLIRKEKGFIDFFLQLNNKDYQVITTDLKESTNETSFFKSLDHLIQNNPNIKGIYVTNSRASSIASYLQKRNVKNIKLVGYDLLERNVTFLEKGIISFLINQNPFKQGYLGIELLIEHLVFKKSPPPIKYLPLDLITKENLQYYLQNE